MKLLRCQFSFIVLLVTSIFSATLKAEDIKTVTGDFTFYGESSHSLEQCKRLALEGARIAALKDAYGTTVSNDVYSRETNEGDAYFSSLSATEVKGEWIADQNSPEYDIKIDDQGHYIVRCRIIGLARAIGNEAVSFEAIPLRSSDDLSAKSTSFTNGEDLRLFFRAPIDGYVAIFLVDDSKTAWRLLPYSGDGSGELKTRHGKEYVFFSATRHDGYPDASIVDELILTTEKEAERDELYVIFSPKPFTTPGIQSDSSLPPSLSLEKFNKWMSDSRRRDSKMSVKHIGIEITNN